MGQEVDARILPLKMIVGAMAMSLIVFGAVVLVIGPIDIDPELGRILLAVLIGMAVMEAVGYTVFRGIQISAARRRLEEEPAAEDAESRVMGTWSSLILIRSAMAEGLGLFGLAIVLVTGMRAALVAPVLALAFLAISLPSRQKLTQFTAGITGFNPYAEGER